ncbi:MAG: 23S rRNA (adenine(2503)-C(2))-methyltransferase RlmN [Bacteroides sp.]|nr:23S rRNA (adenine(2503)-C(2))-methyltransferase RlmN [Bacteroides sp.]MCM1084709.1 23S rRNA (adenine(2503)-C(2))-methyltransferase RlmN [Bacteroides sp.]
MEQHEILLGKSLEELQGLCAELGFRKFTARQICEWIYRKKVRNVAQMTNLSLKDRAILEQAAIIGLHEPLQAQQSADGTRKYLFASPGAESRPGQSGFIESVMIPDGGRATLCVSSQSGCRMNCAFCATGSQGFNHHLPANQILNQICSVPESDLLTNLVFMGMGEPFDNLDNVLKALQVLTSPWGWAWSPTRITVSTVGVTPQLPRFMEECRCHLAISLHNPFAGERAELMPVEKAYPVKELVELLKTYDWSGQRRVSFEYILIDGFNDTPRHALATARLLHGLPCRVNLINYHEVPGKPYRKSSPQKTESFQKILQEKGITCTLRRSRGEDIMAACGLLAKTKGGK